MIKIYDIWFSNLEITNSLKLKLLDKFKNTEEIWKLNKKSLEELKINEKNVLKIVDVKTRLNLDKYAKFMEENKINLILCNDEKYPESLSRIDDKPACLYVRGKIDKEILLEFQKCCLSRFIPDLLDQNLHFIKI